MSTKQVFNPLSGQFDLVSDISNLVTGPASSTDNAIARFDGTTGKLVQNSLVTVGDTGIVSNVTDPVSAQDAATKNYIDNLELTNVTTSSPLTNVPLTGSVPLSIDGITLVGGNTVMLANQTTPAQNGVYSYSDNGITYTLTLATGWSNIVGRRIFVVNGTRFQTTTFTVNTTTSIILQGVRLVHDPVNILPYDTAGSLVSGSLANPWGVTNSNLYQIASGNALAGSIGTGAVDINISAATTRNINIFTTAQVGATNSGAATLSSGSTVNGNSGDVSLTAGAVSGSGLRGIINLIGRYVNAANTNISNVLDPVSAQDAATKNYVDTHFSSQKELFTLSGTDITNQYVDLAHVAKTNSIDFLVKGGGIQIEGAGQDYTVNYTGGAGGNTRITFVNGLATGGVSALIAGDVVVAKYQY